jgi:hypothetical protein
MQRAVKAGRREDDLVRALLRVRRQFRQRFVRLLIVDQQHAGVGDKTRERDEIGARRLRLPAEQLVDLGETGDRGDVREQGVAVRLCRGSDLRADLAGRARFSFDHHRLLEDRLHRRGEWTGHNVGRAARGKRVDDGDRVRRIALLCKARADGERSGGSSRYAEKAAAIHGIPPYAEPGPAVRQAFARSRRCLQRMLSPEAA